MKFRILQTGFQNAAFNMALDEVLIERIARGESKPALRLYRWKPAAISIGYFQSLQAEVDETRCQALGIDIIRRQTGGGAVLHDQEMNQAGPNQDGGECGGLRLPMPPCRGQGRGGRQQRCPGRNCGMEQCRRGQCHHDGQEGRSERRIDPGLAQDVVPGGWLGHG